MHQIKVKSRMKKICLMILLFTILASCDIGGMLQKMAEIDTGLTEEFDHTDILTTIHLGTKNNDDYIQIDFNRYPVAKKAHSELELLANEVSLYFKEKYPEYDNLDFLEVRFTKADKENAESFVSFKFE